MGYLAKSCITLITVGSILLTPLAQASTRSITALRAIDSDGDIYRKGGTVTLSVSVDEGQSFKKNTKPSGSNVAPASPQQAS